MRNITLKIRCSSDERDLFEQASKSAGFSSVAGWLRSLAYESAICGMSEGNIRQSMADVRQELSRIGNNLNQLTKSHNSGQSVDVAHELEEVRSTIKTIGKTITKLSPNPYIRSKDNAD